MVQEIYDTDLPGMCFMKPPASRSDGNICKSNCSRSVESKCNNSPITPTTTTNNNNPEPCYALYSLNVYFPITCSSNSACPSSTACCNNNYNNNNNNCNNKPNNNTGTANACRSQAPPHTATAAAAAGATQAVPSSVQPACEHTRTLPQHCHGCGGSAPVGGGTKVPQSVSFTHAKEHKCCPGYAAMAHHHQNGRHHKVHSNACQLL